MVRRSLRAISVLLWLPAAAGSLDAQGTWTGVLSDSMCKRHHESGAEGQTTTDADCTRDCVRGGSQYVLVVGETVYAISNQDQRQLPSHAGMRVVATGTLHGEAIEITALEKAP